MTDKPRLEACLRATERGMARLGVVLLAVLLSVASAAGQERQTLEVQVKALQGDAYKQDPAGASARMVALVAAAAKNPAMSRSELAAGRLALSALYFHTREFAQALLS